MNLYAEVARWVHVVTRPFRPVAVIGLVAGAVVVLALLPWTLHSVGTVIGLLVVAALAVAGPWQLMQHRRRLRRTLGDEARLRAELGDLHGQASTAADRLLAAETRFRNRKKDGRGVLASLKDLRELRSVLNLNEVAEGVRELYVPVSPPALGLSGLAALAVLAFTVLAPVVVLISVIGLLLR